jgi:signal transduction histidine kinase
VLQAASNPPRQSGASSAGERLRQINPSLRRIVLMAALFYITSQAPFSPAVPGTELCMFWIPGALLVYALWLLPRAEAPVHVLTYAVAHMLRQPEGSNLGFDLAILVISVVQATILAFVSARHLRREQMIMQPSRAVAYTMLALLLTAIGATAMIGAASLFDLDAQQKASELAGDPALAWRYWWLGHTCGYVAVGGSIGFLAQVSLAEIRQAFSQPRFAKGFAAMALLLLIVNAVVLPVTDISPLGLSAEVRLGITMIPASIAFAMTALFLGFGAAFAILAITAFALLSISGASAAANWQGIPPLITPLHVYLTMMATTCWVIATISRQMHWARQEVVEAGKVRARFAAMLTQDLRAQLDDILGFSEQVQEKRQTAGTARPIENIQASSRRLLATIEGLLGHGEHGTSVFELEKHPISVAQAVAEAIAQVASEAASVGCKVSSDVPSGLQLDADPTALRQMLLVLLSYPLRFVAPGATIAASARQKGADTILEIRSTGLINAVADDRDKIELQLVSALALAHGARLTTVQNDRNGRLSCLTFFATHSAN